MTTPDNNDVSSVGGGVAGRLAKVVADATIYTRQKMGPHAKSVALSALGDFTDLMSDESKSAIGPLLTKISEDPDLSPEARALVDFMLLKRGQWQALAASSATGVAFAGGIVNLLTNELNPVILRLIAANPNNVISPADAASAVARGIDGPPTWDVEANKSGISDERFKALVEMNKAMPAVAYILDMVNHNVIGENVALHYLQRHGFQDREARNLLALRRFVITPADLGAMWNRGIVSTDEGARIAAMSGVSEQDWKRITELGGEPLPPGDLGEAFRRGFIDADRYRRGIVQGPIRNEWFDVLDKLQFSRMSTVDAADAVNQGHITLAQGTEVAHQNGLVPTDFAVLIESAGTPPGIDFATEALNRGFIGVDEFTRMFKESRIKNRYGPLLLQMRTRLIPQETVRLLYRNGVYPRDKTLETLMAHGFTAEDAAALLALEETRQDETTKELTRAQIVDMYDEQILDAATTRELLVALGYAEANVDLMIALADIKRTQRFVNAAVARVRSAFITGKLDDIEVSAQLDALQVSPQQRDELLAIWDIDRTTISKTLTPAQIRQAFKKDFIQETEAVARLVAQGYDDTDANLYLKLTA